MTTEDKNKDTFESEMSEISEHIDIILGIVGKYGPNRAGSLVLTKLEEAGMWAHKALYMPIKIKDKDKEEQSKQKVGNE